MSILYPVPTIIRTRDDYYYKLVSATALCADELWDIQTLAGKPPEGYGFYGLKLRMSECIPGSTKQYYVYTWHSSSTCD